MLKKTFTLMLFLFLSSCGYEAIHSKKNIINYNFYISELSFEGDRDVNLKIKEKLNNYTLNKKNKIFTLKISSTTEKIILLKNLSGDATSYKSMITVNIRVQMKNITKSNLQIVESFNYNNNTNKFDLKRYEREIKNNLAETITDKLIFKLSSIQ
jgi:outer membrane lipopolysaccharide assembly protein LptE/RlpB